MSPPVAQRADKEKRLMTRTALLVAACTLLMGWNACRAAESAPQPATSEAAVGAEGTTPNLEVGLYIFILAGFLGFHIISRVPPLLHTPLMSATNAISGISLIGSMVVAGALHDWLSTLLGCIA